MIQQSTFTFESEICEEEKSRIQSEVKKLSVLNPLYSSFSILSNWIAIFFCIVIAYTINNSFLSILAILIVGTRQHALLIIMHDGAHYRLAKNKRMNQYISDFLCAFPLFITTSKYRDSHLAHHKYLNTDLDPDWMLRKGLKEWEFPKSRTGILLILARQLLGLNAFHIIGKMYRFGVSNNTANHSIKNPLSYKVARIFYYILLIGTLTYLHIWPIFFIYWLLPAFTLLPFLLRLRSLAEHFGLAWSHELNSSRNVNTNLFEKLLLVPLSNNYHLDHHLYPSVPLYNLKKLHKVLLQNPVYKSKAVNSRSYLLPNKESVLAELENNIPL